MSTDPSEINGTLVASIFKQLVSGEPVEARLPYGRPFTLTQYAKLIFNCNELPKDVEQTEAYFRRFIIIPFDVTIPESEQDQVLVEEIIDIADDSTQDEIVNDQGVRVCNGEFIARSRLRIDTRKWLAAKLIPRLYGDKDNAPVSLKFPSDFKDTNSLLPMSAEVFRALGSQEITPGQARILLGTLKDYSSSVAIIDLNQKMSKLLDGESSNE